MNGYMFKMCFILVNVRFSFSFLAPQFLIKHLPYSRMNGLVDDLLIPSSQDSLK